MTSVAANHEFSLTRAGPFYEMLCRARLVRPLGNVRWLALVAIGWLPIALGSLLRFALGYPPDAIALDATVHVRLLVSVPLLVFAEGVLEMRCRDAADVVRTERLAEPAPADAIFGTAERLRASPVMEAALACISFIAGQAVLWGVTWPGEVVVVRDPDARVSFPVFWYATVALPLVYFLVLRWMWRWGIWTYVLVRLSRIPLATNALHPDRAAGLQSLSMPIDGFACFVTAQLCVAASAWIVKMDQMDVSLQTFGPRLAAFIAVALLGAFGPLLLFAPQLYRARHHDVRHYHALATEYVDEFRRKWITYRHEANPRVHRSVLGAPDLQSLSDLGHSYMLAEDTRLVPFGTRSVVALCTAALVPMVPVLFATVPLTDIARHVGRMLQLPGF